MTRARLKSGIELEYDERGSGEPLLLIMGIGAQLVLWPEGLCDAFAASGFRVIRFDHRDVGLSSRLDDLGVPRVGSILPRMLLGLRADAPYALEEMAEDAVGLLDHLGIERAHLLGVSMGGMVAQTMAITHPHRVRSLVSMMSHTGKADLRISDPRALAALFRPVARTRAEVIESHVELFRVIRSPGFDFDEADVRMRAGLSFDRGVHPRGFLRHLGAIAATGDRTPRLRFVRAPTLVVHGTADPLLRPLGGELTAKAIPGARLELVEGLGHDLPRGAWPLFTRLVSEHARRAG